MKKQVPVPLFEDELLTVVRMHENIVEDHKFPVLTGGKYLLSMKEHDEIIKADETRIKELMESWKGFDG